MVATGMRMGREAVARTAAIGEHGLIGDLHTAALVSTDGAIDWYCAPHFDSPSVFAHLLDAKRGGLFRIGPSDPSAVRRQLYVPETNVLVTRFLSPDGVGEVTDFMPVGDRDAGEPRHSIVRRVASVRGDVTFGVHCEPAFDYARARHEVEARRSGVAFVGPDLTLALATDVPLELDGGAAVADLTLREGERVTFVLQDVDSPEGCDAALLDESAAEAAFQATADYWRTWLSKCTYRGRWRDHVHRSALMLKLLTFAPTGAMVAAPTMALPEAPGGERNWDYRYTWVRDAAFVVYALLRIGLTSEAAAFMDWLRARFEEAGADGDPLQPVYGIDGRRDLPESTLDHLEGHLGSQPVRVGNAAATQRQLDIYGATLDAIYLYNKHGTPVGHDLWTHVRRTLDWLIDHWGDLDRGIWEVRSGDRPFVYSRMMCWVAFDRGIRVATKRGLPADLERWRETRDAIYDEVMEKGWSEERGAFVQAYGGDALDASALLMPLVFFVSPTESRMARTIEAVREELAADHLVHRYRHERAPDGLEGAEGTFSLCTFWLVEALTRAGRLREARLIFEKMLGYSNHLGLYAEQVGPTGEALGNFPQAFTHIALISAAYNLDRALGGGT